MTEPSEETLNGARDEVAHGVRNGAAKERRRLPGLALIALGLAVGAIFLTLLFVRAATTERSDTALCEKIDHFIVATEAAVARSTMLTTAEKKRRLAFYENFRNDPPVCRTGPAPKLPEGR